MSYILEALKKAERARELGRDPASAPRRETVYGARRRIGLREASGALALLLLGGGLLLWWLGPAPSAPLPPAAPERARTIPETPGDRLPATAVGDPASADASRAAARPALRSPQAPVPPRPSARPAGPLGRAASMGMPAGSPAATVPSEADRMAPTPPAAGVITDAPLPPAPQPLPTIPGPRAEAAAAPPPPRLQEAVARMSLTVLVYTEARARRLVVINGRQYLEGQLVDDRYLLESILPEGALLVHEGERVLLGH